MDQDLTDDDSSESRVDVAVFLRNKNNEGEKLKKTHSGNKLAKLRRYASRVHFAKIYFGEIHFWKIHF